MADLNLTNAELAFLDDLLSSKEYADVTRILRHVGTRAISVHGLLKKIHIARDQSLAHETDPMVATVLAALDEKPLHAAFAALKTASTILKKRIDEQISGRATYEPKD